jgi:hypothetical protein
MVTPRHPNDTVIIAPGVLLTVVRLAVLDVTGVIRMGSTPPGGVDRLFRRVPVADGVQIAIEESTVTVHERADSKIGGTLDSGAFGDEGRIGKRPHRGCGLSPDTRC